MLKNNWRVISRLQRVGDNLLIVTAFLLTYYWRDSLLVAANALALPFPVELPELGQLEEYFIVLAIAIPVYNALLSFFGAYRSMRFSSFVRLLRISVFSSAVVFLCEGSFLFLLKLDLSRSFVGIFCALSAIGLFFVRLLGLSVLRFFRVRGRNYRNVLIVGTGLQARRLYLEIVKQGDLGVRVAGFVYVPTEVNQANIKGVETGSAVFDLPARVISDAAGYEAALKKYAIDEVLFSDVLISIAIIQAMAKIAVEEGVQVTIAADLFSLEIFRSDISYFGNFPLIHLHPSRGGSDNPLLLVKRSVDVLLSATLLIVLFPALLLVALVIKLTSPGPVFFRQRRVGLNGRVFTLLKFRSMIEGAEAMLDGLREQNEMQGPVFKIKEDPRVTSVGKFIRRFSIDELPQLFNVLIGDMSLVGPRPPLPDEVTLYQRRQRKRLSMRPGLTCTWQVSGRNDIPDFDQWAKLDLEYIDNWSLWTDFKLLIRTIPAVFVGSGAR